MIPVWRALPGDFQPGDEAALEQAFGSWLMLFGAGPMVAAILVTAWTRGRAGLRELFARVIRVRVGPQWFLVALLLPLVPQWSALWAWAQGTGHAIHYDALNGYFSSWLQITVIGGLYFVTEELGWRGFLLPRMLARQNWLNAALRLGLIWAVWHYPYWLTSSWGVTGSWTTTIIMALASTGRAIALSIMLTWMFKHTRGSVLLAMLFHGSNNANFDHMFAAAGDASVQGPAYMLVQSLTALVTAGLLILAIRVAEKRS